MAQGVYIRHTKGPGSQLRKCIFIPPFISPELSCLVSQCNFLFNCFDCYRFSYLSKTFWSTFSSPKLNCKDILALQCSRAYVASSLCMLIMSCNKSRCCPLFQIKDIWPKYHLSNRVSLSN